MRSLLRKIYPARCAYLALSDWQMGRRYRQSVIDTDSGATHAALSVDESVAYIEEVFGDYKRYAGIDRFFGRVAEIGPGDNSGVGLLFLADGCASVDLADAFYSRRDLAAQVRIYRALAQRHPALAAYLGYLEQGDENAVPGLQRWYGADAAGEIFFQTHTGYDFIVSRAVLEHLRDPLLALTRMSQALNPGGMLLHKVDLRDHNMFSGFFHELKFLETGDKLYRLMTQNSGRPNRILLHRYRTCLEATRLDYRFLVTRLAGVGDIVPHVPYEAIAAHDRQRSLDYVRSARHNFTASFDGVDDADLGIAGFFLIAKKR